MWYLKLQFQELVVVGRDSRSLVITALLHIDHDSLLLADHRGLIGVAQVHRSTLSTL